MSNPQVDTAISAGLHAIADKAFAVLWPLIAALFLATAVRVMVIIYMRRNRHRRATINLASYLAFASTLFALYLLWGKYIIQMS